MAINKNSMFAASQRIYSGILRTSDEVSSHDFEDCRCLFQNHYIIAIKARQSKLFWELLG